MFTNTSSIATDRGARYVKQFVGHWGRRAARLEDSEGQATMHFDADEKFSACVVEFASSDAALELRVSAADAGTVEAICEALTEHLVRFSAKTDKLDITWSWSDA
ncbi:DUF2218 domain-containing protein [Nocardia sp. NPDC059239]|uniref:DUF2218 domain-containing protein n=1 Tax=unclassified Nocardia TaxID=2637762 RepID=UPI0036803AF2